MVRFVLLCVGLLFVTACQSVAVSRDAYDRDLAGMKQQQDWLEAQKKTLDAQVSEVTGKLKQCMDVGQVCARDKQAVIDELASTKKALDQCTTGRGQGAKALADCQIEADKLRRELAAVQSSLRQAQADNKAAQDKLKTVQDKLDRVEAGIKQVRQRLQKLVESGKLRVKVQNGFLVIEMQSDILFDVGKADVKPGARPVLAELAGALKSMPDRRFQVAGHTDNTGPAALNWHLSVNRALAVVEELLVDGVNPATLSAGGYGPYVPVAANETEEGKARNRRVEFLLLPDLSDLLDLSK
jgi:chemotaxis protein MotB